MWEDNSTKVRQRQKLIIKCQNKKIQMKVGRGQDCIKDDYTLRADVIYFYIHLMN